MLQQLQRMQRRRSESSDEEGSSDNSDGHNSSYKLRSILRLRKRVKSHPLRIVTKYRRRCLDKVGIVVLPNGSLSAPFAHHHISLRLRETFGKMVGLWRCHYAATQILELLEHRRVEQAAATCVQLLKSIDQTALDHGSWNNSMMLLPWDDPLRPDLFGGDPEEMMAAAQWNRGIRDLQSQVGASARAAHHAPQEQADGAAEEVRRRPTAQERKAAAAARARQTTQAQGGSGATGADHAR